MQNTIQKFRQSSIVFKKPGILSESLKTLRSSNYPTVQYFLLKLRTRFLLTNVCKGCAVFIYLFTYLLSYLQKIKKTIFSTHLVFTLFLKNSKSKQNKKNPTHHFADITKRKTCAKFQRKILNSMVVGAPQIFQFFRQKNLVSWK